MQRLIVSDFDGTITDLEEGSAGFNRAYLAALTHVLQVSFEDTAVEVDEAMRYMDAHPGGHGWFVDGEIVAPATADPFVRMRAAVEIVLDRHGLIRDRARRDAWLDKTFGQAREEMEIVFKHGVLSYLTLLDRHSGVFITNAVATLVQERFDQLADDLSSDTGITMLQEAFLAPDRGTTQDVRAMLARCRGRVYGEAGKQIVEPMLQVCDAELRIPGLERPMLLHRGRYYRQLQWLLREAGLNWSQLWCVGDIFEMDLAMPWTLGANVILVDNGVMPDYERAWLATQERVHVTETLSGACEILFGSN